MALRATLRGDGHTDLLRLDLLRLDLLRLDLLFFRRQKDRFLPLAHLQLDNRLHVLDRFFLQGDPVNLCLR